VAVELGKAFVVIEPDTKGFGKKAGQEIEDELGPAVDKVNTKISSGMSKAFALAGAAVAGVGVAKFFKDSVSAATDLNEQVSKVGVVFGDSADKVLAFGKNAATSIGASNREAVQAAGTFGNLLKSTGIASDKAADMSVNMVQLAGDLASFNNVPVGEALDAIRSGLVGETEPLKRFAVNLNESTLKAEAMKLGLSDGKGVLDANAKAQAAYSIILGQTTDAQGDYARTADSLANRQRTLSALFEETKATVGQALLPVMKEFVQIATDSLPVVTNLALSIANIAAAAGAAIAPVAGLLGSFAGSEAGQFAITAGLAYIAIEKLGIMSLTTSGSMAALKTAIAAIQPETVILAAGVAAVVNEYSRQQAAAQENKARHEALLKAFNDQAPLTEVNKRFGELVDQLSKVTGASEDAEKAVTDTTSAMEIASQLTEGDRKVLEKYHITTQDIADAINKGGPAWDTLSQKISDTTDKYKMQMVGGRDWIQAQEKATAVLDGLQKSQADAAAGRAADAQANIEQAVSAGLLTQAWVNAIAVQDQGVSTEQMWLDIQSQAEPILQKKQQAIEDAAQASADAASKDDEWAQAVSDARDRMADADKKAMDAAADLAAQYGLSQDQAERLASANDVTKTATQERTDAEKELKDALDKVTESQSQYLFVVGGAQATVDDTTKATRDFIKTLTEGSETVGRGTEAMVGNTNAAIDNRDSLQTLRERALDVIQGYDKLGYSAEQVSANQQQLAADMRQTAIDAGATAEEADAVRDSILGIPIKHETDITAQAEVDAANAKLDNAAREREAVISVSLSAVGVSNEMLQAVMSHKLGAQGAFVPHTPGGSLWKVGEGAVDEAIVRVGPHMLNDLQRIVGPARFAQAASETGGGQGQSTVINVNLSGVGPGDLTSARRFGRIVGETAADVLAHRQLAAAVRVA